MLAAAWSSKVDFPIPGSPPSSTSDPGTTPPPSTRSNSSMLVDKRAWFCSSMSAYNLAEPAADSAYRCSAVAAVIAAGCGRSSTNEFHAPQSLHLPSHFGDCEPHSWHTNTVFGGFMLIGRSRQDRQDGRDGEDAEL